jgi:hypothetical protein
MSHLDRRQELGVGLFLGHDSDLKDFHALFCPF